MCIRDSVKTLHGKWNSQTFTIGYLNQERHTSWFSWRQLLCCHLFAINYLLLFEMYEIFKEQIYVPAVNAQNRLFRSDTILDKTTWENVFINAHYLTQQNYFQINGFAQRIPPPPIQSCFLQMLRDPAFFWRPNNTASRGRGEGRIGRLRSSEKMPPSMQFSQQFCPRLYIRWFAFFSNNINMDKTEIYQ